MAQSFITFPCPLKYAAILKMSIQNPADRMNWEASELIWKGNGILNSMPPVSFHFGNGSPCICTASTTGSCLERERFRRLKWDKIRSGMHCCHWITHFQQPLLFLSLSTLLSPHLPLLVSSRLQHLPNPDFKSPEFTSIQEHHLPAQVRLCQVVQAWQRVHLWSAVVTGKGKIGPKRG